MQEAINLQKENHLGQGIKQKSFPRKNVSVGSNPTENTPAEFMAGLGSGEGASEAVTEDEPANDTAARPAISGSVEDMEQYTIVFIGYSNWWSSIPMPIASFLEEYDFTGKTIIPGGGTACRKTCLHG